MDNRSIWCLASHATGRRRHWLGLIAAFALSRVLRRMLFDVEPTDPVTFALIAVLLAMVSFLASYVPTRRATRVDPLVALRSE